MSTCMVCIEEFTKQPNRKQAKCPYCDVLACVKCTQTYLLSTTDDAHCMECRKGWSREILDSLLLTTWINGEYKLHRQNVLLDRERSRLPAAQVILERRKRIQEDHEPVRQALLMQITDLDRQISVLRNQLYQEMRIIDALNRGEDPFGPGGFMANTEAAKAIQKEERRVFVMPCPATDCRGFLSQAYKCGVCDIYACPECREVKGKDRDTEHTCNADTVATVQRMKKECRPCPECGAQIFKIEGCDQMWCTACSTPFSWITGKKVTNGVIHNPHYFEFLRKSNGGVMPRTPGDIPCGANLPGAWTFEREINRAYPGIHVDIRTLLYGALNRITHIQHVEIPGATNHAQDTDNTAINLQYLTNEISEARWKQLLQQREKRRLKKDELRMRYEAFVGACVDLYGRIMAQRGLPQTTVKPIVEECHHQLLQLREIFNESLMDISRRYKCSVLQLDTNFRLVRTKYKSTKKAPKSRRPTDSDSTDIEEIEDEEENTLVPL